MEHIQMMKDLDINSLIQAPEKGDFLEICSRDVGPLSAIPIQCK